MIITFVTMVSNIFIKILISNVVTTLPLFYLLLSIYGMNCNRAIPVHQEKRIGVIVKRLPLQPKESTADEY